MAAKQLGDGLVIGFAMYAAVAGGGHLGFVNRRIAGMPGQCDLHDEGHGDGEHGRHDQFETAGHFDHHDHGRDRHPGAAREHGRHAHDGKPGAIHVDVRDVQQRRKRGSQHGPHVERGAEHAAGPARADGERQRENLAERKQQQDPYRQAGTALQGKLDVAVSAADNRRQDDADQPDGKPPDGGFEEAGHVQRTECVAGSVIHGRQQCTEGSRDDAEQGEPDQFQRLHAAAVRRQQEQRRETRKHARDRIGHSRRDQGVDQRAAFEGHAGIEDFHGKNRRTQRTFEDGRETGRHADQDDDPALFVGQLENLSDDGADTGGDLRRGPFAAA